jgi:hypothetical protein
MKSGTNSEALDDELAKGAGADAMSQVP